MHRRFALLLLVLLIVGCERYRSRAQGPFPRHAAANPPAPLALSGSSQPITPGAPDEAPLVPPRPPEPGAVPYSVAPPQPPKPPVVEESRVETQTAKPPAPPAPQPATSAQPSAQALNLAEVKRLAGTLGTKLKTLDNYEARFTRRENLDGTQGPMEEVIFRFRAEPMAVYMKNVSAAGKGREVLYNPSQYGNKIHVIIGEGDTRFFKAGTKGPSLSPDSPQVRSKSRHSIVESGMAISGNKFIMAVAKLEAGKLPADALKYAGKLKREDLGELPLEGVEQSIRKGDDESLPAGGTRHWFFDAKPDSPSFGLAVLVILYDGAGKELEYYRYTHLKSPANLTNADFDPAKMGKK
jgi:hypothetical protein